MTASGRRVRRGSTAADFRRIALSLEGTSESPHFDRTAFRVARIYATLAPDGRSANLRFSPDEQELKCMVASDAFAPIPNAWGRQGWTIATLAMLTVPELENALRIAYADAQPKPRPRKGATRR